MEFKMEILFPTGLFGRQQRSRLAFETENLSEETVMLLMLWEFLSDENVRMPVLEWTNEFAFARVLGRTNFELWNHVCYKETTLNKLSPASWISVLKTESDGKSVFHTKRLETLERQK